jgi:phosphoadenosine phosphosulfate reductase
VASEALRAEEVAMQRRHARLEPGQLVSLPGSRPHPSATEIALEAARRSLADASAEKIVAWAASRFGDGLVLSTSFGIQSAVMLHLVTRIVPHVPVVWVDTGYLPPETYRFADELTRRLDLDLRVFQSELSPARMEALHGRLWEREDLASLDLYDRIRKVEPMRRALDALGATAWLSGIRAEQTEHRRRMRVLEPQDGRVKVSPILSWSSRDVHAYLRRHDLPVHPLFEQGYATVGDWHSSRPVSAGEDERATRFGGRVQECGLHLSDEEDESLSASGL